MSQNQSETKVCSGSEFNKLFGFFSFAHLVNYGPENDGVLSYGLNVPPKMVSFYKEEDVTSNMKFCDVSQITIPDDARVEIIDGNFKTDRVFVKMFVTGRRFSYAGFSYTIPYM